MLTRNCATDLFQSGDFNIRVTLFDRNPKHFVTDAYKAAWIETIRDSLGGGIANSNEVKSFLFRLTGQKSSYFFDGNFSQFIQMIKHCCQKPTSMRITLLGDAPRTWIILIP